MHNWSTFGAKTNHGLDLTEAITFPLIIYFMAGHELAHKWHFVLGLPSGSPEIPTSGILVILGAHNFTCKPSIKMRWEEKLYL
jgi:hypothetical protein